MTEIVISGSLLRQAVNLERHPTGQQNAFAKLTEYLSTKKKANKSRFKRIEPGRCRPGSILEGQL
jgi:hypothetical protein